MRQNQWKRRAGLRAAAGLLGASAAVAGFAMPANAATVPAANHMVIGAGSNTTYFLMNQLSQLFNQSPGCDLAAPSGGTQNLNYSCPSPQNATGGENGLGDGSGYTNTGSVAQGDPENPYNDVVVEEPPLGSSNGIKELEQRGTNPAPSDFARSSRGPNNAQPVPVGDPVNTTASDPQGLNFVAYAADALPWLHWTKVSGTSTPSAKIKSLSITQLAAIYNGTITDWSQIPKGKAGPIAVYMAQAGSGTEGTWAQILQLTSATPAGVTNPATHVIFENEIKGILNNGDEKNAIFYFSYGKFQTVCVPATAKAKTAACGGDKSPSGSAFALGEESITTGGAPIVASQTTIQNGSFPTDRLFWNVYSNGTNATIPASSQAALNFVSEWGFICKQDSAVDSNSGLSYGSEIQSAILANGVFPLSSATMDAANVDSNAVITDPGYKFVDPQSQAPNPATQQGRCRVFTTDGDGIS
jgi:ABC-type phosphate transport system substrate-binding protein